MNYYGFNPDSIDDCISSIVISTLKDKKDKRTCFYRLVSQQEEQFRGIKDYITKSYDGVQVNLIFDTMYITCILKDMGENVVRNIVHVHLEGK